MLERLIEEIEKQQNGKEGTAVFAVGEQLKDICKTTLGAAEIVLQDLAVPEMSITECEKKIKALADKRHKKNKGHCAFVSPSEADKIIREFYGIPADDEPAPVATKPAGYINIDDFM